MKLPTLYTERLIIRPLSVLDADDMFEYAKTPYVGPMAGWPPHISIVETISIIKSMITIKTRQTSPRCSLISNLKSRSVTNTASISRKPRELLSETSILIRHLHRIVSLDMKL